MGVGQGVLVVDNFHPFPDTFFDKQVLVNISEKAQLQVCHFKTSLPGQIRESVILGEIKTIMLEAHVSEILEHVC